MDPSTPSPRPVRSGPPRPSVLGLVAGILAVLALLSLLGFIIMGTLKSAGDLAGELGTIATETEPEAGP
ncbi:hypothetical protein EMQ25_09475 [Arsenicitalea aurantiaca]|uniref:Uncharacterized protein n=1 Tax=Arsenicitalea aurantiaca TaxID=1783274 RepID=A0A433XAJ1_9HYPH|nr:hypothetical protein [Arsenicitalea aurantiaca]RUT31096.1 hypothetical protein EMQ25_09475 [Arsenicitalea aurantiaca]